jgi:hypothetical protein
MMAGEGAGSAPKAKAAPTKYVILERVANGEAGVFWAKVGETQGTGTEKAMIERWATRPGTFKRVAASAWGGEDGVTLAEQTKLAAV